MLNKILQLERPLAVLDCETTGINPKVDRIIQITVKIHYPEKDPIKWSTLVNPEIPILNKQHGITDEMVQGFPSFKEHAEGLAKHLLAADIDGYNVQFDIDFITNEMTRAGIEFKWSNYIIDSLQIYKLKRGHTLSNCYLEFGGEDGEPLPKDTDLTKAHDAEFDVHMTECALRGQLLRYNNLPRTIPELSEFCFPHPENAVDKTGKFVWVGLDAAFNFGKWRGRLLKDPACRSYLKWLSMADGFPDEVTEIAENALKGKFPIRP